jgi:hypothetical protein
MGDFKKFIKEIQEDTSTADIATVPVKLDLVKRPKILEKGKKCKMHKKLNCEICESEKY